MIRCKRWIRWILKNSIGMGWTEERVARDQIRRGSTRSVAERRELFRKHGRQRRTWTRSVSGLAQRCVGIRSPDSNDLAPVGITRDSASMPPACSESIPLTAFRSSTRRTDAQSSRCCSRSSAVDPLGVFVSVRAANLEAIALSYSRSTCGAPQSSVWYAR